MLSLKLVHLIEVHIDGLSDGIVAKLHTSARTRGLQTIPAPELRGRIHETLCHFHAWLITNADHSIAERYRDLGRRHAARGAALPDLCWAIVLMKEHLWDFVEQQALHTTPVEIHGELELMRLLDLFFDCVICHVSEGYDEARSKMASAHVDASAAGLHVVPARPKWLRTGKNKDAVQEER